MISACLIAKNEEKWLPGCLEILSELVDEIILVDTGSTDHTIEIARDFGARVSSFAWQRDFAKARNASLEKATQRWILIIDPDERIAKQDIPKLKALTAAKDVMAYSFNSRNYSSNLLSSGFKPNRGEYLEEEKGHAGYFESRKIRLFQNVPSIRFVGSVHELVESTVQGKIVASEIPFHHYGNSQAVSEEKSKPQFYQEQGVKKVQENPTDWKSFFELGVEYLGAGEFGKAINKLEKARSLRPRDPLILSNLGYAYLEAGKLPAADGVLKEALRMEPVHHDSLLNLGVVKMRQDRWKEGADVFKSLIETHKTSFMAFRNRGLCLAHMAQYKEAAECFERALQLFPDFVEARIDLGITCFAAGRSDLARPILANALKQAPKSIRARAVLEEIEKTPRAR